MRITMNTLQKTPRIKTKYSQYGAALCCALYLLATQAMAIPFSCWVSQVIPGEARVQFVLRNLTADDLYILTWQSPWEGWKGRFLSLYKEGKKQDYLGPMIKRLKPEREDYQLIKSHQQLTATLDLKQVYRLSSGTYQLEYLGYLQDVRTKLTMDSPTNPIEFDCPALTFNIDPRASKPSPISDPRAP